MASQGALVYGFEAEINCTIILYFYRSRAGQFWRRSTYLDILLIEKERREAIAKIKAEKGALIYDKLPPQLAGVP